MRAYVLTDRSLARHAGRFVWLAIDTEKAKNAPVRQRLKIAALPTFFILDPADEKVAIRWVGGATAPQLAHILDDGARAVAGRARGRDPLRARADSLYGEGEYAAAVPLYEQALAGAPLAWAERGRTVESLLFALSQSDQPERCATLALAELPRVRRTSSAVSVAGSGLDAAISMPADAPRRRGLLDSLEAATREIVADTTLAMAADDRCWMPATTPATPRGRSASPPSGRRSSRVRRRGRARRISARYSTRTGSRPTSSWASPSAPCRCSRPRSGTFPTTTTRQRGCRWP